MKPGLVLFVLGLALVFVYMGLALASAFVDDVLPVCMRRIMRGVMLVASLAIGAGFWLE